MNKTAIKNFAVWARRKLISDITYKAGLLGITEEGISSALPQSTSGVQFFDVGTKNYTEVSGAQINQRKALVDAIRAKEKGSDYKSAFNNVIEEVAYTWFNRLIAVRFMEVNDYLPSGIRVLSSENEGKLEPDFVTSPFDTDLEFTPYEKDVVYQLKDENRLDELFRMLFIKQCNKLHGNLPVLFEDIEDYTELLLTISFTDKDGIVYHLTHDISEDDFNVEKEGQVEIIGWLYQFYISEKHENVINILKGTVKKEDIPAATALFTTDWVVKYIVDNSLGRYWVERNPGSDLTDYMEFFVTPKDGKVPAVDEKINPEEIKFLDPCMGSGHFLVYAFDLLMRIYAERGWTERDAAKSIIENNLYGLDIDDRSAQLAYFAVMMKARQYNRRVLTFGFEPHIMSIVESNDIPDSLVERYNRDGLLRKLVDTFKDAKETGSIIPVSLSSGELDKIQALLEEIDEMSSYGTLQTMIDSDQLVTQVWPLLNQARIMIQKYDVVDTNPPYLNKFDDVLKDFINKNYKEFGGDLFSVFMYKNFFYCKENGYTGFMTPFVWMFIKTYESLRNYIIKEKSITTLIQFEYSAFEEATVPICSFVLKNGRETEKGLYFRLSDFRGGMSVQRDKVLEALDNKDCGYFYETTAANFSKIPGAPVAYWVGEKLMDAFDFPSLSYYADARQGLITGDNGRFLRSWFEISIDKFQQKWLVYNKGGDFRKWYGNNLLVVNWENDGFEIKNFKDTSGKLKSRPQNTQYYKREGFTWTALTTGIFSARYMQPNQLFDAKGSSCFSNTSEKVKVLTAFTNSIIGTVLFSFMAPTLDYNAGVVSKLPVNSKMFDCCLEKIVDENIAICKTDWDSFETSWDFKKHPLI